MNRLRPTTATLMAIVVGFGLAFASLRDPSAWWEGAILPLTIVILSGAVLCAVAARGAARLVWLGCAIFGGAFFAAGYAPKADDNVLGEPRTTAILDTLIPVVSPALDAEIKKVLAPTTRDYSRLSGMMPSLGRYRRIAHSWMTLFAALLGAGFGLVLASREVRPADGPGPGL